MIGEYYPRGGDRQPDFCASNRLDHVVCGQRNRMTQRPPLETHRQVEITLLYLAATGTYEVQQIKNSACYHPGEWVDWDTVIKMCNMQNWTVTCTSFEFVKKVMDLLPKISLI